jgi:hypothetical protein
MVKPKAWDTKAAHLQWVLALGHQCLAMLESCKVKLLKEITEQEGEDNIYVMSINIQYFRKLE